MKTMGVWDDSFHMLDRKLPTDNASSPSPPRSYKLLYVVVLSFVIISIFLSVVIRPSVHLTKIEANRSGTREGFTRSVVSVDREERVESDSMRLLPPYSRTNLQWNKTFLICSMIAVSLDPVFLYIPIINGTDNCLGMDRKLASFVCVLRSFADILYVLNIIIKFRTTWEPSYNPTGKKEFIDEPWYVAKHYLKSDFIIDGLAALPLPQFAVLAIIPNLDGQSSFSKENIWKFIIFCLYIPRVIQASLLYKKVTSLSGTLIGEPLVRAACNLLCYVLASHLIGALWYFFAIESELRCWHIACKRHNCNSKYLCCGEGRVGDYGFLNTSCPILERIQIRNSTNFDFGIYLDALQSRVLERIDVRKKILYCSLWGLQNLSSLGQGLKASTFAGEILFAYFIAIIGLVLFALLIGNMQKYLQSPSNLTLRTNEMKEIRKETEDIMSHFALPEDLKKKVRTHKQNKWQLTRGVELDSFVRDFPPDLKMAIKRHICLPSLKRAPIFKHMDEHLLDAVCDRLKPVLYTTDSCLVREGDPAREILFITHGEVLSITTDGGKTGFYHASKLNAGDLCGEELFAWALDPQTPQLPFSTRTVKALTNVQAFALVSDDLLFLASQFRSFHSRPVQDTFRFYSHHWRTWAACYIQDAWRKHWKRKQENILQDKNKRLQDALATGSETSTLSLGASIYVSRFSSNALRNLRRKPTQPMMQQSLPLDDGPHMQIKTE